MVLIYYAQVHLRWLPFTENKREDVANYIKKEGRIFANVKGKVAELVALVLGRFSIDFRKFLQRYAVKGLLPQFRVREF